MNDKWYEMKREEKELFLIIQLNEEEQNILDDYDAWMNPAEVLEDNDQN